MQRSVDVLITKKVRRKVYCKNDFQKQIDILVHCLTSSLTHHSIMNNSFQFDEDFEVLLVIAEVREEVEFWIAIKYLIVTQVS